MTETTPATAWMDRLSNRLGSLIPGGSRLPARHPLKVSLVMGTLGLLSGWLSMALGVIANGIIFGNSYHEDSRILAAGAVLAVAVVLPWAAWMGTRARWFLLLVVVCVSGNYAAYLAVDKFQSETFGGMFLFGSLTGLYLSVCGMYVTQRLRIVWLLCTTVITAVGTFSFLMTLYNPLINQFLHGELERSLIIAWFFSNVHTPAALCLGYLRWDTTPRPKFEPAEKSS